MITFTNVTFSYPTTDDNENPKPIYDHFTGELPSGFVHLVGPNGCGKTTLLLLASGRLCPTCGSVNLFGTDTQSFFPSVVFSNQDGKKIKQVLTPKLSEEDRNKLASVIYQNMEFETDEHVEVLLSQVYQNGYHKDKNQNFFNEIITTFNLTKILQRSLSHLSKGEIQRTLLAFSILYGSKTIFMDEPVFAMELHEKENALTFLKDYCKKFNTTIYLSLHELELTKKYAETVILFFKDRSMSLGTPEEVLTDEDLEKSFGVPASQLRNTERLTRKQLEENSQFE